MPKRPSFILLCAVLALLLALLGGCGLEGGPERLLSLPKLPDEYLELQKVIDQELRDGAVYAAPASGANRQSVQLRDLNGDGTEEVLAFFRSSGEQPLKIRIFLRESESYVRAALIEGDGTSIESIDYTDMNGDGWSEVIVGWGMGGELKMLSVYSIKGFQVSAVATANYSQYLSADMDGDGLRELMVVRPGSAEDAGMLELIRLRSDGETEGSQARLSAGAAVSRLTAAALRDLPCALYVESTCPEGLVTDIFTWQDGQLTNISLSEGGVSTGTLRSGSAASRDLDGDGVPEIPIPRSLNSQSETVFRVLDWYGYNSRGKRTLRFSTYHNYSDSWYLILPEEWGNDISIRREDGDAGERAVVFSRWNGDDQAVSDFLIIYTLSGDAREVLAQKPGRFILYRGAESVCAGQLLMDESQWSLAPTEDYLRNSFYPIYSEWISGQS